jgi:hypothetical protein
MASLSEKAIIGLANFLRSHTLTVPSPIVAKRKVSKGSVAMAWAFVGTLFTVIEARKSNKRSQRCEIPAKRRCVDDGRNVNEETISVGAYC